MTGCGRYLAVAVGRSRGSAGIGSGRSLLSRRWLLLSGYGFLAVAALYLIAHLLSHDVDVAYPSLLAAAGLCALGAAWARRNENR